MQQGLLATVGGVAVAAFCLWLRKTPAAPTPKRRLTPEQDAEDSERRRAMTEEDDMVQAGVDALTDSERFEPRDPAALEYLREHGYVVFKGVATEGDIAVGKRLLWEFLSAHGMKQGRPETWGAGDCIASPANGILAKNGFGQSRFLWHLRTLPRVIEAFSTIWGTDDLVTSFDGGNIYRPWDKHPERRTVGGWWHIDQGLGKQGFQGAQGLVTLYDADETTGGLTVIPGSHLDHNGVCERNMRHTKSPASDFVYIRSEDEILERPARLVRAKAGDLAVWDSRTVHCNFPGSGPARNESELVRAVGYICMAPRNKVSQEVLGKRREMVRNRQSGTHWPQEARPTCPPTKGPLQRLEDMTELQRKLIG